MGILPLVVSTLLALASSAGGAADGGAASEAAAPVAPPPAVAPEAPAAPATGDPEAPAVAAADPGCAEAAAIRVQAHYEGVTNLVARFEQRSKSVAFAGSALETEPTRGEVAFAKPGQMRWSYESPEPSLVVSDGRTLWIYDPTAREAQALVVDEGFLSGAALQFLLGEGDLLESFQVTAPDCAAAPLRLELRPRAESSYERLELWVEPATGAVRATAVDDLFGNRTEVEFQDLRTNQDLPQGFFTFEAPPGVRLETISGTAGPGEPPGE